MVQNRESNEPRPSFFQQALRIVLYAHLPDFLCVASWLLFHTNRPGQRGLLPLSWQPTGKERLRLLSLRS